MITIPNCIATVVLVWLGWFFFGGEGTWDFLSLGKSVASKQGCRRMSGRFLFGGKNADSCFWLAIYWCCLDALGGVYICLFLYLVALILLLGSLLGRREVIVLMGRLCMPVPCAGNNLIVRLYEKEEMVVDCLAWIIKSFLYLPMILPRCLSLIVRRLMPLLIDPETLIRYHTCLPNGPSDKLVVFPCESSRVFHGVLAWWTV